MKKICLDIGNTCITYCEINKKIGPINRFSSSNDLFKKIDNNNFTEVLISSVVPNISKNINNYFTKKKINVFEVSYKNCGISLKVKTPSEVGNDRICNVAAANKLYGYGSIIIDFGTATTYDITNDKGEFIGGAIAPGIDVSADHLISKASLLRETVYQFPKNAIGNDTKTNIQSGVMYSGLHAVSGMINQIKKELKLEDPNIILTGGFGSLISKELELDHIYNENLTIEGIISIYNKQKEN